MKNSERSILIVDDMADNIHLLREILREDYKIHFATDGIAALELAASLLPDIVLLDIMMPGMGGYEVCTKLKDNPLTRDIPIIFVTALGDEENEAMGFSVGGVDYITKPLRPLTVKSRIRNHLALRDTTRTMEERNTALQQSVQLREEMDRIANQDMKGPVSRIIATTEALLSKAAFNEQEQEMVNRIHGSALYLLEMVNASLNLHKIEAGVYVLQPVETDLLEVLGRILREQHSLAQAKRLTVQVVDEQGAPATFGTFLVMGEAMLCHSLFGNLLERALEHAPLGSTVTLILEQTATEITVSIHQSGQLPLEIRDRFFEKYLTNGGMDAYSSRLIARLHGGDVVMHALANQGTTFRVRLPRSTPTPSSQEGLVGWAPPLDHPPAPTPPLRLPQPTETIQGAAKILIVDDQLENIHLLQRALTRVGEIYFATSGEQALQVAANQNPDLILLDVIMPDMDGYATLVQLRHERVTKDIPVIFVTAMDHKEGEEMGLKLGAIDYITKPFHPQSIRLKVQNILELKRLRDFYARLSLLDGLTGIPNRRRFDEALELEWRRGLRSGKPLSLLIMDVDFFKPYNDHLGHIAGDECLRKLAKTAASCMERPGDTVARYGGEEFVCLLPETNPAGVLKMVQKIQQVVHDLALPHPISPLGGYVTLSYGGATLVPQQELQAINLIEYADNNLYRAKAGGRNRFVLENPL